MRFDTWDFFFNAAILAFWFHAFNPRPDTDFWNPYVTPVRRLTQRVVDLFRPAFPGLPDAVIAALAAVALIVFRGLISPRPSDAWTVRMGFLAAHPRAESVGSCILFSCLVTGVFLLKTWAVALLYLPASRVRSSDRTRNALHVLTRPFSMLPHAVRLPALIGLAALLALAIERVALSHGGIAPSLFARAGGAGLVLARAVLLGASLSLDAVMAIQQIVIFLVIGSWGGAMFGLPGLQFFCREWMDLALGPIRRYSLRIGLFDLTVLVFLALLFAVQFALHFVLSSALEGLRAS